MFILFARLMIETTINIGVYLFYANCVVLIFLSFFVSGEAWENRVRGKWEESERFEFMNYFLKVSRARDAPSYSRKKKHKRNFWRNPQAYIDVRVCCVIFIVWVFFFVLRAPDMSSRGRRDCLQFSARVATFYLFMYSTYAIKILYT